jgi:hypothetical protein
MRFERASDGWRLVALAPWQVQVELPPGAQLS